MRKLFVLIIGVCFLSLVESCISESKYSESGVFYPKVSSRSVIIGKIVNLEQVSLAPRKIRLLVDDITIDEQHSFETDISDNGDFIFNIPLYHSINTYLYYGDSRITPYLFPDDTIHIDVIIAKNGFKTGSGSVKFDDKHDKFESDFLTQHNWIFHDQIDVFNDKLPKDKTPQQLKGYCLDFEKELAEKIDERVRTDSIDSFIADYLKLTARYNIYRDIINIGQKIENQDEKKEFYEFLTNDIVFNEEALITSDYNFFLNSYRAYVERGFPDKKVTTDSEEEAYIEELKLLLENDFQKRDGIWSEFLAAYHVLNFFSTYENFNPKMKELCQNLIEETFYGFDRGYTYEILLSKLEETEFIGNEEEQNEVSFLSIPADAILLKNDSLTGEQLYDKIINDNKGKVVYMDFWATWCAPCKQQMQYSIRLHEMFKDKNVSFVYLCLQSHEVPWRYVISKEQIKGTHILVNDYQNVFLNEKFSINGIPRYVLIDSAGKVIDDNAPRPNTEIIVSKITELTKDK